MYIIGQTKLSGSLGAVGMVGFKCFAFLLCLAWSGAVETGQEEGNATAAPPEDVAGRELTDGGYVIRYKDQLYGYPLRVSPVVIRDRPSESNRGETNEIQTEEDDKKRPLFYFTTWEAVENPPQLPKSRPFIEIRKKRDLGSGEEIPETSKVGKLRRKRTYCGKCGYGGYRTYIPVTYAVYPVYYGGGGGGGGKGCHTCGGGYGGGGGGGGSFSYSSSSSQSSSGSFGYGK